MAAVASFSVACENKQCHRLADPENLYHVYIPGFKGIIKNIKLGRKKNIGQVAAIFIIGGKLKIQSGDLNTHG